VIRKGKLAHCRSHLDVSSTLSECSNYQLHVKMQANMIISIKANILYRQTFTFVV